MLPRKITSVAMMILIMGTSFSIASQIIVGVEGTNTQSKDGTTIWSTDQILTSDYTIREEETLIIEPGVTVSLDEGVTIYVGGTLKAVGTKSNMITFTHKDANERWWRIGFNNSSIDSECILKYCKIEYALWAICCWGSSPTISDNIIANNGGGITCDHSFSTISNNKIISNTYIGIYCSHSSPMIFNNNISSNYNDGVFCTHFSSPTISNNIISNNSHGVYCYDFSYPVIHRNNIYGNIWGVYNSQRVTIDATHNWWGSPDGPSGAGTGSGDKVSDYVEYDPWLTKPVKISEEKTEESIFKTLYLPIIAIIFAVIIVVGVGIVHKRKNKKVKEETREVTLEKTMSIMVKCPYCQTNFQITPTKKPFKAKCPKCGKVSLLR